MHTLIVSETLSHMKLWAQSQQQLGNTVGVYTTKPKFTLHGFPKDIEYHFVPGPVQLLRGAMMNRLQIPRSMYDWDSAFFDKLTARVLSKSDIVLGAASSSLLTARAAQRKGAKFVLDRACPHIQVQEALNKDAAKLVGGTFNAAPDWFLQRQLEEYAESDYIVVPSEYTKRSFSPEIQAKIFILRLTGTTSTLPAPLPKPDRPFTVGCVGGAPLRKGYVYLLEAWKQLGWTDAQLLLRTSETRIKQFPVLEKLIAEQPNIQVVDYVPDIADFYQRCDAFILPSIDDGFGLALFEAAGQGIPCIVTTNCGSSELLEPETEALVIEPFSPEAIKTALTRLRESPELRATLAEGGLRKVRMLGGGSSESLYTQGVRQLMEHAFPS
jgi:glycosyltransferase involved in cell wall biosynthesis